MYGSAAATVIVGVGLVIVAAGGAYADSVSSTSGGGASVSVVTGSNGGTTIVVNSDKPCRTESAKTAQDTNRHSGSDRSQTTRLDTGAGGLSGSTTIGPNGQMSVDIHPGAGGTSTTASSGNTENKAASGECVIVVHAPGSTK